MSATQYPHLYKKDQILKIKPLQKLNNERKFFFSSLKGGISTVICHCNNLNELTGRALLGIWKLCSFFGISKDPSDKLSVSKSQSVFDNAKTIFQGGGNTDKIQKELTVLLENILQNQKILEKKVDELSSKIEPEPLTKADIEKTAKSLEIIETKLTQILGS